MPKYELLSHDLTSISGAKLAKALNCEQVLTSSDPENILINWGVWGWREVIADVNLRKVIEICCSKKASYKAFKEHGVKKPKWTSSYTIASDWLKRGWKVYTRDCDAGCQGNGIRVTESGSSLPRGLFYTRHFPTVREFRIYTWRDLVLSVFEKKDLTNNIELDPDIRASNDWYYCRNGLDPYSTELVFQAIKATKALGLDFSGVDIALDKEDNVCVFECNSAPWLSDRVAEELANQIKKAYPL